MGSNCPCLEIKKEKWSPLEIICLYLTLKKEIISKSCMEVEELSRVVVCVKNLQENSRVSRTALKVCGIEQTQLQRHLADIYVSLACFRSGGHWRPPFSSQLGFSIWSISIFSTITPLGWRQVRRLALVAHIHIVPVFNCAKCYCGLII